MIVCFNPETLEISYTVNDPVPAGQAEIMIEHGQTFLETTEFRTIVLDDFYITDAHELAPRLEWTDDLLPSYLLVGQAVTINDILPGVRVTLDDTAMGSINTDGTLELQFNEMGAYVLTLTHRTFRTKTWTIEVSP
ncbi:MAG: hypothetical protein GC184_06045 [Rhizobiales bacterium]|nr:hypothetical protein [Hyphomicrobiales bacterium]